MSDFLNGNRIVRPAGYVSNPARPATKPKKWRKKFIKDKTKIYDEKGKLIGVQG